MAFKAKLDCKLCKQMTEDFFFFNCSETMMATIVTHLLKCPECLEYYKRYASDSGFEWDVMDDVAVFDIDNPEVKERIEKSLENFPKPKDLFIPDKWQQIVSRYQIKEMMGMKSFKDLINEYDGELDMQDVDYVPWYKYVMMKNAKRIDHLECCLNMEMK